MKRRRRSRPQQFEAALGRMIPRDQESEGLAAEGRFGDTELAHVSPREAAILKALGGSGTRNPRSGLREYFGADDGAHSGGDFSSETGGIGMGRDDASAVSGGDFSSEPGIGQSPVGTPTPGEDDFSSEPGLGTSPGLGRGPTSPVEDGFGAQLAGMLGLPTSFSGLAGKFDPRTQEGMFNALTGQVPGLGMGSRGMLEGTRALGGAINSGLQSLGIYGSAPAEAMDFGNAARFDGDQFAGIDMGREDAGYDRDRVGRAIGATPVSNPGPKYGRSDAGGVPEEISSFLGPGMSDLQSRALISTYGTQGVNSGFRSDPVKRYYARLLNNGIIDDDGKPQAQPYTLPIEHQYWQSVLGKPASDPSKFDDIYGSISRYL